LKKNIKKTKILLFHLIQTTNRHNKIKHNKIQESLAIPVFYGGG